jgi:hypothetical protein
MIVIDSLESEFCCHCEEAVASEATHGSRVDVLRRRAAARPFLNPMTRAMGCFVAALLAMTAPLVVIVRQAWRSTVDGFQQRGSNFFLHLRSAAFKVKIVSVLVNSGQATGISAWHVKKSILKSAILKD